MENVNDYNPQQINYALVEGVRPAMYKIMKYWGKKPHNIWADYIQHYCPKDGIVLDPFAGSAISAFESAILGRHIIATDINPLTSFVIEALSSKFNKEQFEKSFQEIYNNILNDGVYRKYFTKEINGKNITVYNYVWEDGLVKRVRGQEGIIAKKMKGKSKRYDLDATQEDIDNASEMESIKIPYWYPTDEFPTDPSINSNFYKKIGGNTFDKLWTKRNLYILAKIFYEITIQPKDVQLHLLCAFIHTLHLVCKMVVPRKAKGNRPFSGSWGRADYMIRRHSMEQNPLVVFYRSCFDKQGVEKGLINENERLGSIKINDLTRSKKIKKTSIINFGTIDVADIQDYIKENSIDFIITDPPYGGLVQYMDLSMVWLVWLQHYNKKYEPDPTGEITFKKGITSRSYYTSLLNNAFQKLYAVLKPHHYMVVTFHNQDIKEWNDFVNAIRLAGFTFEKVTHQYNRRSGESNVSNPYGTTGSDFYIRCKKDVATEANNEKQTLDNFIVNQTIHILQGRGEKTPLEFIKNGLLPNMLQAGYLKPEEPKECVLNVLKKNSGNDKIFQIIENHDPATGPVFWFNAPSEYMNHMEIPLNERVEIIVRSILRRKISISYDDIVAEIFKQFPNGQTPDPKGIRKIVEKYASPSAGKWKIKSAVEKECTQHTHEISLLWELGKKANLSVFVGKREQPETVDGNKKLSDIADYTSLKNVLQQYNIGQLHRIEMMDVVWIKEEKIEAIFEVENSTNFIEAVSRASNVSSSIPKFMVIPDKRENELNAQKDKMFVDNFHSNGWKYLTYKQIYRLYTAKNVDLKIISLEAKHLN